MTTTSIAVEGIYSIEFIGIAGWGTGELSFDTCKITGQDEGGAIYNGTYVFNTRSEHFDINLRVTVPVETWLVTGIPAQAKQYTFNIKTSIPRNFRGGHQICVPTEFGQVLVRFDKLADLSD